MRGHLAELDELGGGNPDRAAIGGRRNTTFTRHFTRRTWYRKTFSLPQLFAGRKVYIEFEAVRQVAEVYCNGSLLGASKNGFAPFGFDLTPHLRFGARNVLAVMCDNRFMKDPPGPALRT